MNDCGFALMALYRPSSSYRAQRGLAAPTITTVASGSTRTGRCRPERALFVAEAGRGGRAGSRPGGETWPG